MTKTIGGDDGRPEEAFGGSTGVPAEGIADVGAREPIGRSGMHHWRESTITEPGLTNRGNVFFAAIEMTRMPMILTDPSLPDNPIVFANKAFLDLTLYEESEVLGRNCRFLQGAGTDREQVAELRDAIARRDSIALEILNYRRDGSPFWNAVFIGPVYDVSGELLYFFASQLDVTRRRETEQFLRQAQKMEAIGQLTAGLAHDFNNLLQVISGSLELASARIEDEKAARHLDNAQSAASKGAKLTGQLLAFARKTRLTPKTIDVSQCIQGFVEVMESALGKDAELHLSLRRGLPKVNLDADQFEMAILNTVINAKDAMREKPGGLLTISTGKMHLNGDARARELPAGDYVVVEIIDEGTGMPPHVARRAVEPFFTTKPTGQGTGLGLAMASGFVQQSRGRLEIESDIGKGTTIRMLFPVSLQDDESEPASASVVRAVPAPAQGAPVEHILVVEDSPEVLALAREILEDVGYRVSTAVSGDEGLALLKELTPKDPVDLLFTDLVMPGSMNGIVLAQEAAKVDPAIGLLMTTGYNEELVADGPEVAALDVLGKPYRRPDLLDRVRQALNNRADQGKARRNRSDYGAAEA